MISIDSLLLNSFYEESQDFFLNAKVQKIQQPTRKELVLHLRNNGESRKFYININPQFYHAAFMSKENELKRNLKIPKQPPMFCMLLRKHMEGAKIIKVQKPQNERIIELFFENYNEIGDRIEECLSIELMGKHSNVVLYNTDTNIIIGCAHNVGAEKSKERELAGGLPYIYPPKQSKKNLLAVKSTSFFKILTKSKDCLKKTISENFFGLSQVLVEEIASGLKIDAEKISSELETEEMQVLFITLFELLENQNLKYSISENFEKYSCKSNFPHKYESANAMIDDYFAFHIQKQMIESLKLNLKNTVNKELKKQKNNLKNQELLLSSQDKSALYKLKADLIMSNLYCLKSEEGTKKIALRDFEDEKTIEIELDENLTLTENANKYYSKYNKTKKAYTIALEFSLKTKQEIDYLNGLIFSIEIAESILELNEISNEITPAPKEKNKKTEDSPVQKLEINSFTVYIGKNNKQNDLIFSKISSPNDIWLHALNIPGAHILVKVPSGTPDDDTLLKAAQLAKQYSSAKNSGKVSVIYTQRKYLKKPQNQKGGMVTYKKETEVVV